MQGSFFSLNGLLSKENVVTFWWGLKQKFGIKLVTVVKGQGSLIRGQ